MQPEFQSNTCPSIYSFNAVTKNHLLQGGTADQVHCGMVYLDFLELLLPAYAGQLLTCVADIYYTAAHAVEIKSVMWAEDLVACMYLLSCDVFPVLLKFSCSEF